MKSAGVFAVPRLRPGRLRGSSLYQRVELDRRGNRQMEPTKMMFVEEPSVRNRAAGSFSPSKFAIIVSRARYVSLVKRNFIFAAINGTPASST